MTKHKNNSFPWGIVLAGAALIGIPFFMRGSATFETTETGDINEQYFSRYLDLSNISKSNIASENNIDNSPPGYVIENARVLAQKVLDPLQDWLNHTFTVNSWYRSPEVNQLAGGTSTSDHLTGNAADVELYIDGKENNALIVRALLSLNLPFDQCIIYDSLDNPTRIHLSYDPTVTPGQQKREYKFKDHSGYSDLNLSQLYSIYL